MMRHRAGHWATKLKRWTNRLASRVCAFLSPTSVILRANLMFDGKVFGLFSHVENVPSSSPRPFVARGRMAPLQNQMAKTVASAAGLTGSLPTAEAHSDLASETPIEPLKANRPPPS